MRKSDGSYTYFVPDVAYHLAKFERGFAKRDQHPGHRPPRHDRARPRRPAGGRRRRSAALPGLRAQHDGARRARRPGGQDLQARRQLRDAARPDRLDQPRRGALLHAEQEGRHRVHLRRRPGAQAATTRTRSSTCSTRTRGSARCSSSTRRRAATSPPSPRRPRRGCRRRARPRCCASSPSTRRCSPAAAATLAPHEVAFYLRELAAAFHSYYGAERFLVDDPRAGARAPGPARGDAPGHPQRAGAARRRRARAHGRERPEHGMKASLPPAASAAAS